MGDIMRDNKNNIIKKYISTAFFMLIIFASIIVITPAVSAVPTKVICIPWQGDIAKYHTILSGTDATLKCVIQTDDASSIYYKWNFGDSTESTVLSTSGKTKYDVEIKHTYTGAEGTPFTAKLIVADNNALTNPIEDPYRIMIQPIGLDSKVNIAIDTGLWYLYKNQYSDSNTKSFDGSSVTVWSYSSFLASPTASAVQAFEINGHKETGNFNEDPYAESVQKGLNWLFNGYYSSTSYPMLNPVAISTQHGTDNPDSNGNGKGIEVRDYGYRPVYEGGQVMDAIIASGTPDADSGRDFDGDGTTDTYREVLEDMADMYAYGQYDSTYSSYGIIGGWRYNWGDWPDNSAAQWAAIGMIPAQVVPWNVNVPQWVKQYDNNWLNYSHSVWAAGGVEYGGFGYTGPGSGNALTPSGMVQLDFVGATTSDPRWVRTERWLADYWNNWRNSNNVYGYYAFAKAMRLANPDPVATFSSNGYDWYRGDSTTKGLAEHIADHLNTYGSWDYYGPNLGTAWSVIILRPALFKAAPIACFVADPNPNYPDKDIKFDPSCSGHSEPGKDISNLTKFEWDWDNDGTYDQSTTTPTTVTHSFPCAAIPCTYPVKLKVTDDNTPALTSTYSTQIKITYPPHPPVGEANGPYMVSLNTDDMLTLDGTDSYDPNEGKHEDACPACPDDTITAYDWDLGGAPWNYGDKSGATVTLDYAGYSPYFSTAGVHNIGLRVTDNTKLAYPSSGMQDLTDEDFTTVKVYDGGLVGLAATPGCGYAALSWTDISASEYIIYRSDIDANAGFEETARTTDTSKVLGSVPPEKTTYFRVGGVKGGQILMSKAVSVFPEAALCNPVANAGGPYTGYVGEPVNLDGSGSSAKLGTIVAWDWDLDNDGEYDDAYGEKVEGTWNSVGTFNVGLRVRSSDSLTLTATAGTTVSIWKRVDAGSDATINEGDTFISSGTFIVPDVDIWTATVDYGDGTGEQPLVIGETFVLSHTYADDGVYTVTVRVEKGLIKDSDTAIVTVKNVAPTVTIADSYNVTVPVTLRIAGQGKVGNSVKLQVIQDNAPIASGKIIRTPGSPNEQDLEVTATIDLFKPYSGRLIFDTETAYSGGTPVWVIIDGVKTKVTTFNTQKSDPSSYHQTYDFALSGLVSVIGKEISFTGSATDPGEDDLTFKWLFGDGGSLSNLHPWLDSHSVTETVKHTYSAAGLYTVKLDVTDDDGGVGSASKTIEIS